jgi:hypothetical protein
MGPATDIASEVLSTEPEVMDEKIAAVQRTETEELGKKDLHLDDEAGDVAAIALASGPADAEISKRVLRKIDFYILPFLCITYGEHWISSCSRAELMEIRLAVS